MTRDRADRGGVRDATELDLAALRDDGSVSRFTTMWVVGVDEALYVRSAYGPDSSWYRRALRHGRARIRASGVERDVVLHPVPPDDSVHTDIDAAFHKKYDAYGPRIVDTVVGPAAANVTLRLDPADA